MKTTLDIIDLNYAVLNVPAVTAQLTGGVYKNTRPVSSDKTDVVIGCLPVSNDQLQRAVANVNIHVPNLVINQGNYTDYTQPDFAALRSLAALVTGVLNDVSTPTHWFAVQQQNHFSEPERKEHYVNIRVNFYSINILNN